MFSNLLQQQCPYRSWHCCNVTAGRVWRERQNNGCLTCSEQFSSFELGLILPEHVLLLKSGHISCHVCCVNVRSWIALDFEALISRWFNFRLRFVSSLSVKIWIEVETFLSWLDFTETNLFKWYEKAFYTPGVITPSSQRIDGVWKHNKLLLRHESVERLKSPDAYNYYKCVKHYC